MADQSFLKWPFFTEHHRELAHTVDAWAEDNLDDVSHSDADAGWSRSWATPDC
jgi:acyl-CoA dehydrogenase